MAKEKVTYQCQTCEYVSSSYLGRCPECQSWGSFIEQKTIKPSSLSSATKMGRRNSALEAAGVTMLNLPQPVPLAKVSTEQTRRNPTGFSEMDRVLGGGIIPGSYVLIGGDPGIGKSTLMLQVATQVSERPNAKPVLYVAGEESPHQIKMRADRLGLKADHLLIYPENNIHTVVAQIMSLYQNHQGLDLVVIDSIQSIYSPEANGTPGSVSQIKDCAGILMEVAKSMGITIFLIGHVTKEGAVSGPKLLEHTVDAVLYFEGDKYKNLRILRTVKNRFGNTQEIGVFEMGSEGLREVSNPSQLFLSMTSYQNQPGSVIVSTIEGTRPILVELQALVGQSAYSTPRRVATGVETNRVHQIIAVLERRLGLDFSKQDIYVNVVGGLRIDEPAADLGIAVAIITSLRNVSVKPNTILTGEIGLTGEIRPVRQAEVRIQEARRIGFEQIIMPVQETVLTTPAKPDARQKPIGVIEVANLMDALQVALVRSGPSERLPERLSDSDMSESFK